MEFPEVKPNEYVVRVLTEPDGMDRVRFVAYWQDDRGPQGIRGAVFNTQLAKFTAAAARENCAVRIEATS